MRYRWSIKVKIVGSNHLINIDKTIGYHHHIIVVQNVFQKSLSHSIVIVRSQVNTVNSLPYQLF